MGIDLNDLINAVMAKCSQPKNEEIIQFLRSNVEPIDDEDFGLGYRASAYLTDGTYLPCVIFRNRESAVNRALGKLKDVLPKWRFSRYTKLYNELIRSYVTYGNRVGFLNIENVEKSKFAIPIPFLKRIGEVQIEFGAGFAAKMKDGKFIGFGTDSGIEFFCMPDEYGGDDIVEIINDGYVMEDGQLCIRKYESQDIHDPCRFPDNDVLYKDAVYYRGKPYFICYLENL